MEQQMSSRKEQQSSKKAYQTPELTVHGSVEELTQFVVPINPGGSTLKLRAQ